MRASASSSSSSAAAASSSSAAASSLCASPASEELAALTCSFVEVAIHTILHARGVYPPAIFERRREYGTVVWMSRHPDLNAGIQDVLLSARGHLARGAIQALIVVLLDRTSRRVWEQYRFAVDVHSAARVSASYSDLETAFAAAISTLAGISAFATAATAAAESAAGAGTAAADAPRVKRDSASSSSSSSSGAAAAAPLLPSPPSSLPPEPRLYRRLPENTTFSILLETHEMGLVGANDSSSHWAAMDDGDEGPGGAAPSSTSGGGKRGAAGAEGAYLLGVVGTDTALASAGKPHAHGHSSSSSSTAAGAGGAWLRVDRADLAGAEKLRGARAASEGGGAASSRHDREPKAMAALPPRVCAPREYVAVRPIKAVRAGALSLDVDLELPLFTAKV